MTRDLAKKIEKDLGISTGWQENGGMFIASTKERLDEYKRLQTVGKYFGIDSHVLGPQETKDLYPLMNVDDIYGTLYSPGDGCVEPADYTTALGRYARKKGGKMFEGVTVTGFEKSSNLLCPELTGVMTNQGLIKTNKVVLCGGVWSRDLGRMAGV